MSTKSRLRPDILGFWLAIPFALILAACALPSPLIPASSTPVPIHHVPEMQFVRSAEPLPAAPARLAGFFAKYGPDDQWLEVCRLETNALNCTRYQTALAGAQPGLMEVSGTVRDRKLEPEEWRPLDWDAQTSRDAAQAELVRRAPALSTYDWSRIALPRYAASTADYLWPAHQVAAAPVDLYGYDMAGDRIIWRVQGPNLPMQNPLVTRYPALYLLTRRSGQGPVETYATIEGFVEE